MKIVWSNPKNAQPYQPNRELFDYTQANGHHAPKFFKNRPEITSCGYF